MTRIFMVRIYGLSINYFGQETSIKENARITQLNKRLENDSLHKLKFPIQQLNDTISTNLIDTNLKVV